MRWIGVVLSLVLAWPALAWDARLSWRDNASTEQAQEIERRPGRDTSTAPWGRIASVPANVVLYTDTGLAAGAWFCWRVRAVNQAGASGYTSAACFGPPDDPTDAVIVPIGTLP